LKPDEPSSAENRDSVDFFSTCRRTQGNFGGSACPRSSGPNENRRADTEDLAGPV
jgi:hypothetical protein